MSLESKHNHTHEHRQDDLAKRDDLLWTTKQAMQTQAMPTPRSAVGALLDERYAALFESLRDERRGSARLAPRAGASVEGQDLSGLDIGSSAEGQTQSLTQRNELPGLITSPEGAVQSTDLGVAPQFVARDEAPQLISGPDLTSLGREQEVLRAPQVAPPSWVWIASQALGANLKRLGFEPSELDDIRVSLIRVLAADYPKLKMLTKLPASLSPHAPEKIVDDIRVMALAYMMNELLAKSVKDAEASGTLEEDAQPSFEIPVSVANRFKDIPAIIYDPMDVVAA